MSTLKTKRADVKKQRTADVVKSGKAIVLPDDPKEMSAQEAIVILERKAEEENKTCRVFEEFDFHPFDVAWALQTVLDKRYGFTTAVNKKTMFGEEMPNMINIDTGKGETVQVIWGKTEIPGVEGWITPAWHHNEGRSVGLIHGEVKQKYKYEVTEVCDDVRAFLKVNSLYKGRAVKLTTNRSGELTDTPPKFLDLSRVNEEELVFPRDLEVQVQTSLFTPIEKTSECLKYGVPLKRGVLLEGPYGTGKTLTAYVTAKKCEANGWTFVYLDRVTGLKDALAFAKQYEPAVVFSEDIDRVVAGGRTVKVDDVLNTIDGVESKNSQIITILTTNHVENIEKAMLRPGRLDAVLSIQPPNKEAAQRLVKLYGRGLIDENEDLDSAGRELSGQIPAVIREVVERSKLYAIGHLNPGDSLAISGEHITQAAKGMKAHLMLLQNKPNGIKTSEELFTDGFKAMVSESLNPTDITVKDIQEKVEEVRNNI